jgi:hypothetical protein
MQEEGGLENDRKLKISVNESEAQTPFDEEGL